MSLFNQLGSPRQGRQPAQPAQLTPEQIQTTRQSIAAVKADPSGYLQQQFGVSVPQGANDPMQIMNHLAQSGQLNPQQMRAFQQFQRLGMRRR